MEKRIKKNFRPAAGGKNILENIALVLLAFYPLRHIGWGLDLWDTGYNYANFQYMGMDHMDPMWLFSTYLATAAGNLLTRLPNGGTLFGMNLYTGLFASVLGLMGYFFCTRGLKMPRWLAFAGEFTALGLCWCPTALLYNYLTYILFLGCVILLYYGLTKEKRVCLAAAGFCLGANVLVRFSNLPEMAMIVAVWAYDVILWLEERRKIPGKRGTGDKGREPGKDRKSEMARNLSVRTHEAGGGGKGGAAHSFWCRTLAHTGWCLLGYAAAVIILLGWIQLRYGLDEYAAGISRLFAMTDRASDYKPASMIMGTVGIYVENLYWVVRIMAILAAGLLMFMAAGFVEGLLNSAGEKRAAAGEAQVGKQAAAGEAQGGKRAAGAAQVEKRAAAGAVQPEKQEAESCSAGTLARRPQTMARVIHIAVRVLWAAVSGAMLWWLYRRGFCSFLFYTYDSMLRPGILFLMLAMLIGVIRIFHRDSPREEKLISGMVILVILLTSLGSNNHVYPSLNNLFVAAPYTLWESWRFIRYAKNIRLKHNLVISPYPAKGLLTAFLAMCLFQFCLFGAKFSFAEATGIQDVSARVENNEVLKNIGMSPRKAQWMTEISAYVEENGLRGKEVILYGNIPALSFYLQMPSAFNPWSNLDSYSRSAMEEALERTAAGMTVREPSGGAPVIIMDWEYVLYVRGGTAALEAADIEERRRDKIAGDEKLLLLLDFMENWGYQQTFDNGKFVVYRSLAAE